MPKQFRRLVFIALLSALFVAAITVRRVEAAGPWYVTSGGSDAADCLSPATACATLAGAIGKASAGDTVYVASGTYTGTGAEVALIDRSLTLSGGWNDPFTSQIGWSIVDGQGARTGIWIIQGFNNPGFTVTIDRFEVWNAGEPFLGLQSSGNVTINNSVIRDNLADGINHGGGGSLTLNDSTVADNAGTGIWSTHSLTLNRTTVSGNSECDAFGTCSSNAGGIKADSDLVISNSTVSGNESAGVGGIDFHPAIGGNVTIINSTITGNRVPPGHLAGIGGLRAEGGGTVSISNSVLTGNERAGIPSDCAVRTGSVGVSLGYNLLGAGCSDFAAASDLVNADPMLGPLADNGGLTQTHAPNPTSPTVDAGNPLAPGSGGDACLATDQRGITRPQIIACDIGAFEVIGGTLSGTVTFDGGPPIEGICLTAFALSSRDPDAAFFPIAGTAVTASDGSYAMSLPPDSYLVLFEDCTDGTYEYEYFNNKPDFGTADTVVVSEGATASASASLRASGSISGAVRAHTGVPLGNIDVEAGDAFGLVIGSDTTGADGEYSISGLRPGAIHKVLFTDPTRTYQDEFYDSKFDFDSADSVFVTSGDTTSGIDALLLPFGFGAQETQIGLVDPSQGRWHLQNLAGDVASFYYGNPGDAPFAGDWDCNEINTPGLYRQSDGFAYLRNANSQGIADIRFFFGNPGDVPLAGDWNGDGCDTLSLYRPPTQEFFIINKLGENEGGLGAADFSFLFGNPGDKPVVGDWDGDGIDEVGLHRESTGLFYWRNTLDTGNADGTIFFGDPGDRFVAGDWGNIDGADTPAVFRPSDTTFYFRHTLTQGNADSQFTWTDAGSQWLPVAGKWGLDQAFSPANSATQEASPPTSTSRPNVSGTELQEP